MKQKEINLAEEYYKIRTKNPKTKMTWNEFFDKFGIPEEARTDFAVGAIMNNYLKMKKVDVDVEYEKWKKEKSITKRIWRFFRRN